MEMLEKVGGRAATERIPNARRNVLAKPGEKGFADFSAGRNLPNVSLGRSTCV